MALHRPESVTLPSLTRFAGKNPNGVFRCEVDGNETVIVSCPFDNKGVVSVKEGNLVFTGPIAQLSGGVLNGGTWVVHTGASLDRLARN
jgi:hypothetical protein